MKNPRPDGQLVQLPIRVRRTEYGHGECREVSSVACPVIGGEVPLTRCERCERAEAVLSGEEEGRVVRCHVPLTFIPPPSPPGADLHDKLSRARVSEVMTRQVTCVDSELELDELARIFQAKGLRGAPVVEDQGVFLGMVSIADLLRSVPESTGLLVEDIMTREQVTLVETSSLTEAMELMAARKLHRVAVVSQRHVVVGIVSLVDLARWITRESA